MVKKSCGLKAGGKVEKHRGKLQPIKFHPSKRSKPVALKERPDLLPAHKGLREKNWESCTGSERSLSPKKTKTEHITWGKEKFPKFPGKWKGGARSRR